MTRPRSAAAATPARQDGRLWRLRAFAVVLLLGEGLLLVAILTHRSVVPDLLGRYSLRLGLLAAAALLVTAVTASLVVVCWRRPAEVSSRLGDCCARWPSLGVAPVAGGVLLLSAAVVFRHLVEPFLPLSLVLSGMALVEVSAIGLLLASLGEPARARVGEGVLLVLAATLLAGLGGEALLRMAPPITDFRVLPAGVHRTYDPAPGVMPGVTGPSLYSTNELGIRGDRYPGAGSYNILAIGGSTTECAYLDDTEAWPRLLQDLLNRHGHSPPAWVGNVGRSGHGVVEHLYVLRHFVPQLDLDAVIVMAGINDLVRVLGDPGAYDPDEHAPDRVHLFLHRSFHRWPLRAPALGRPFPDSLALFNLVEMGFWQVVRSTAEPFRYLYVEDAAGANYVERRRRFEARAAIDELPDLGPALDRYERNLAELVGEAGRQRLRLILVTQPSMHGDRLSAEAARLLWLGARTDSDYRYSVRAMAKALRAFNERMVDVCRRTGMECVPLAARMSGRERYFYDDVHLNERGAEAVARSIHEYLANGPRPPS